MSRWLERGERVALRRPGARDEAAFLDAVAASRALHESWVNPPADDEAFRTYVRRARRANFEPLLAVVPATGALVGVINLSEIVRGSFQNCFAGYYAFVGHDGRGLMTDALRLALRYAFETLALHRVEANVQPANVRSIALVKRCGFRYEGTAERYLCIDGAWRDHEHWVMLREDFDAWCTR